MTTERARSADVPEASTRELLAWLVRRRRRVVVTGPSMEPNLTAGDVLLVHRGAYRSASPLPGHVVVLTHPRNRDLRIVKRVEQLDPDGRVRVLSDNLEVDGSDSRSFGPVERGSLIGRVTSRISG